MAQAQAAITRVTPQSGARRGSLARLRAVRAACAERARQRRELIGYAGVQEIGRQTGARG